MKHDKNTAIRFLLMKMSKESLVENIINTYETLFKDDPKGLKKAYHETAIMIQAHCVFSGEKTIDGFSEPFKTELQEYIDKMTKDNGGVMTQ